MERRKMREKTSGAFTIVAAKSGTEGNERTNEMRVCGLWK
jgi:hypothetical protein